jgi:hypothetical protein
LVPKLGEEWGVLAGGHVEGRKGVSGALAWARAGGLAVDPGEGGRRSVRQGHAVGGGGSGAGRENVACGLCFMDVGRSAWAGPKSTVPLYIYSKNLKGLELKWSKECLPELK